MDNLILAWITLSCVILPVTGSSSCPSNICECRELEIASRMETEVRCNTGSNRGYVPVFRSFEPFISSLYLSGVELTVLGNGSFRELSGVREMYLYDNYLIRIESQAFSNIDHTIETLDLQHNKLRNLDFLTTHDFPRLRQLLLRDNELVSISPESFVLVPALENLNLDDNHLQGKLNFLQHPSLKGLFHLNLDHNDLENIDPEDFLYLTNLKRLLLSRNQLRSIDFLRHPIFRQLYGFGAAHNLLETVEPSIFADKHLLKWIELSNNLLTNVTFLASCGLRRLEEIYLSANRIKSLPEKSFQATTTLIIVDVSRNELETLPRCALQPFYTQLFMFDISQNPMQCNCQIAWLQDKRRDIHTEKQSQCANLEFLSTDEYEIDDCEALIPCSPTSGCSKYSVGVLENDQQEPYETTEMTSSDASTKTVATYMVTFLVTLCLT
ncbi:nyctalopin-like [Watersipora subatra]|uniref:nyctalopin-like n=1 Tax=Watersipora subatra TaxID=2589382 RepID=UPI00355BD58F